MRELDQRVKRASLGGLVALVAGVVGILSWLEVTPGDVQDLFFGDDVGAPAIDSPASDSSIAGGGWSELSPCRAFTVQVAARLKSKQTRLSFLAKPTSSRHRCPA